MNDAFAIADEVIEEAYPDFYGKGKGWWGARRIPNYGILRGAIAKSINNRLFRPESCGLVDEYLKSKEGK